MKAPTNISTLRFSAPKKKLTVHHLVYVVLFIGFLSAVYSIADERTNQMLEATHKDGVAVGYQLAVNLNAPTNETCMAFWFGGDSQRVGKAIQKVKESK